MQIRNVYGIDLGTSTVKIYDLKKDTITKEKNMIAIRNREQVIAVTHMKCTRERLPISR